MRVLKFGLIIILAVVLAGCGGGGGGGSAPSGITTLPNDLVGTWRVPGLGLPDDQLGVQSDGDVIVNTDTPVNRADSQAKIGTCSAAGTLTLNGSWNCNGVDYSINANGNVQMQSHSMTLRATVVSSEGGEQDAQVVSGDRVSSDQLPPSTSDGSGDDIELPPPAPGDDPGGDDDIELPPPPPSY